MISLVIPAYNDARLLPRLLDSVDAAKLRLSSEVIAELDAIGAVPGNS